MQQAIHPKLIFKENTLSLILETFGKGINEDGLIIEKATGEPVFTPEGDEIQACNFAGIKKGSEIFIKNDLLSLMNLADGKY